MPNRVPAPPKGTAAGGRRLWRELLERYEFDKHELAVLREAVRTVDQLDALDEVVRHDGVMMADRVHPAVTEGRQLRLVLARLVASLRLPDADDERPQRRGASRGIYSGRKYGSVNLVSDTA